MEERAERRIQTLIDVIAELQKQLRECEYGYDYYKAKFYELLSKTQED